jgi:hypothetical protein
VAEIAGRVGEAHRGTTVAHQCSECRGIEGVAAQDPMLIELP